MSSASAAAAASRKRACAASSVHAASSSVHGAASTRSSACAVAANFSHSETSSPQRAQASWPALRSCWHFGQREDTDTPRSSHFDLAKQGHHVKLDTVHMIASAALTETCQQLVRDSGGKKVMLIGIDGEVLAHAGGAGALDDATGDALAQLVADVVEGAAEGRVPATKDLGASLPGGPPGGLSACATAVGDKGGLGGLFDG